jgi:NADH dehydrogenase [ubiquinone] 1 alpha subcomplex assembly factor 7
VERSTRRVAGLSETPLGRLVRRLISEEGPISVARYMTLALGHPELGYYVTRDPLGRSGDFTTAPEISQIFGELLGLWAAHSWTRAGCPDPVALVELGPGRGTLMADALRVITKAAPAFRSALSLHLVETSPALRERQNLALAGASPRWHDTISTVPDLPLIVLANEFFDALPVRQFVRRTGAWHERLVGLGDNGLAFGLSSAPIDATDLPAAEDGAVIERGEAGLAIMADIASRIAGHGGGAVIIDYGHFGEGFGDTLQAVAGHAFVDPLERPGEADLTAHVDFAALVRVAEANGAGADLMATQADFLEALGIEARAEALKARATAAQRADIDAAVARLTDRSTKGMGVLFKVLAVRGGPV